MSYEDKAQCDGDFYYGPSAVCTESRPYEPTPNPSPAPTPIPNECGIFTTCDSCASHLLDRNCGWCQDASGNGKCIDGNATCDGSFYYNNNAKCGASIPTPTPTPWPAPYEGNASYCRLLTDTWCSKCVSSDPSMSCVWCHDTNECAMGDKDGFFFGTCKSYSYENDDKCSGLMSNGGIVVVRVCIAIFVVAMVIFGVVLCYKVIKQPKQAPLFEQIQ